MFHILVCDDEADILSALRIYLTAEGYHVLTAQTGRQALEVLSNHTVHLILMDIMMPEMDGITATAKLREQYNIPVILLTAKSEDTDKILGLTIGADDYVTKPFNPIELIARVKAQLRRYTNLGGMSKDTDALSVGGIVLNDRTKSVTLDGVPLSLTPTEYDILKLFMENPGTVFSTTQIYHAVWNEPVLGAHGTVAVHIRHLREKLEISPAEPRFLKVVWGKGYKLDTTYET